MLKKVMRKIHNCFPKWLGKKKPCNTIILMLVVSFSGLTYAEELNLVSIEGLIEQEVGRLIIPEIYKRLDITLSINPRPGKRAQYEVMTGMSDGEIMRIFSYGPETPTVYRVPTPYYQLETMAFVLRNRNITIENKEDLSRYRIVKVRGVKHTDNITQDVMNVVDLNSTAQIMEFVRQGRAEVALTNTIDGIITLHEMGVYNIVPIDEPLATLNLYIYLHEKHRDLVPRVDTIIKEMKHSGELSEITRAAEEKIIDKRLNKIIHSVQSK